MYTPRPLLPHPTDPTALIVPLSRGMQAVIDATAGPSVGAYNWSAAWTGRRWYARRSDPETRKHIYLHRWLLGITDERDGDHKDGDGLNNRRSNLRAATESQNMANRAVQSNSASGYKGVIRWRGRWQATVRFANRVERIGTFDTAEEAARAYDARAVELHGEFARLNFPDAA
jgi:hypothetical protein